MAAGRKNVTELLGETSAPRGSNGGSDLSHGGLSVEVSRVAGNPFNTRKLETQRAKKDIAEIGLSILANGQVQASTVVTRAAFTAIFPEADYAEEHKAIGAAEWVQVAGGKRRMAVITTDGLTHLDIREKNDLAASRASFLSATFAENLDRSDLDAIEDAEAVEHVYNAISAQIKADVAAGREPESRDATELTGKQLGKSKAWVSKRRSLAKLHESTKDFIRKSGMSAHAAQGLHSIKDEAEQLAEAKRRVEVGYQPPRKADKGPDETPTGNTDGTGQDGSAGSLVERIKNGDATFTRPRLNVDPDGLFSALTDEWSREDIGRLVERLSGFLASPESDDDDQVTEPILSADRAARDLEDVEPAEQ